MVPSQVADPQSWRSFAMPTRPWIGVIVPCIFMLEHAVQGQVLYNNGPLQTGTRAENGQLAPAGSFWSEEQHDQLNFWESNLILGFSCNKDAKLRLADDFVIPEGEQWDISSVQL